VIPPCPEAALERKAGYEDFEDWNNGPTDTVHDSQPCPEAAPEHKVKHPQTLSKSGVIQFL